MVGDLEARIVAELGKLRPGGTLCSGVLARRLGSTQSALRPVYARLAAEGRIAITQRGALVDLAALRGPYRVALRRPG